MDTRDMRPSTAVVLIFAFVVASVTLYLGVKTVEAPEDGMRWHCQANH